MKIVLLAVAFFGLANADSITVDPVQEAGGGLVTGFPGSYSNQILLVIPQFDPSLGTLQSVDYSFTDNQQLSWGMNDVGLAAGTPFQITFTGAVKGVADTFSQFSVTLPVEAAYTSFINGTTDGQGQNISTVNHHFSEVLTASGTTYADSFIGTGFLGIAFDASAFAANYDLASNGVIATLTGFGDSDEITLDVTYNYTPDANPIPEPRSAWILLGGAIGALTLRARARKLARAGLSAKSTM